jgi:CBS-domain-containing membrane protein
MLAGIAIMSRSKAISSETLAPVNPTNRDWIIGLSVFVAIAALVAFFSGQRMILFPPLVVIAYEMFVHRKDCPWGREPFKLAPTCFLTAAIGVAAVELLGHGVLSTMLSMTIGIVVIKALRLHLPPALAVGLIPQIMEQSSWFYAASVFTGCLLLTGVFVLHQRLLVRRRMPALSIEGTSDG